MEAGSVPANLLTVTSLVNNASIASYKAAVSVSSTDNLMVSPVSILYCTMLLYLGAHGPARKNIRDVLDLQKISVTDSNQETAAAFRILMDSIGATHKKLQLSLANAIFVDKQVQIQNSYRKLVSSTLNATFAMEDFRHDPESLVSHINAWVEAKTRGKIHDIVSSDDITPLTNLVLANAMYFKSDWAWGRFDPFVSDFTMEDMSLRKTNLLRTTKEWNRYVEDPALGAQYLEIPFTGNIASMLLFLPFELAGLRKLERKLTLQVMQDIGKKASKAPQVSISITIPKFRLESTFNAIRLLREIGVKKVFEPHADFSRMLLKNDSVVQFKGIHKTYIDVTEQGTEAAAVTIIMWQSLAASLTPPLRRVEFIANRPFLYTIRHNPSGALILMGRVKKP